MLFLLLKATKTVLSSCLLLYLPTGLSMLLPSCMCNAPCSGGYNNDQSKMSTMLFFPPSTFVTPRLAPLNPKHRPDLVSLTTNRRTRLPRENILSHRHRRTALDEPLLRSREPQHYNDSTFISTRHLVVSIYLRRHVGELDTKAEEARLDRPVQRDWLRSVGTTMRLEYE